MGIFLQNKPQNLQKTLYNHYIMVQCQHCELSRTYVSTRILTQRQTSHTQLVLNCLNKKYFFLNCVLYQENQVVKHTLRPPVFKIELNSCKYEHILEQTFYYNTLFLYLTKKLSLSKQQISCLHGYPVWFPHLKFYMFSYLSFCFFIYCYIPRIEIF